MNCFYHPNTPAVAQCNKCGKGLCHSCATQNEKILCNQCNVQAESSIKISSSLALVLSIGIFMSSYNLFSSSSDNTFIPILLSYMYSTAIWGWRRVNKIKFNFNFILILPLMGWVIYFLIKLAFAMLIGFYTAPIDIYKAIKELFNPIKNKNENI